MEMMKVKRVGERERKYGGIIIRFAFVKSCGFYYILVTKGGVGEKQGGGGMVEGGG